MTENLTSDTRMFHMCNKIARGGLGLREASALREVALLEALGRARSSQQDGVSAADFVRLTGIPRGTVHRMLGRLEAAGFVVRRRRGVYQPGWRLFMLGRDLGESVATIAAGPLRSLAAATGQTGHLGVLHGAHAVFIDSVVDPAAVSLAAKPGSRVPLNTSAIGMAVAAHLPSADRDRLVRGTLWAARTPATITDPEALLTEMASVRSRGYAVDDGWYAEGVRCIAAPVCGENGHVIAAIGITGLRAQVCPQDSETVGAVLAAARQVSASLSNRPSLDRSCETPAAAEAGMRPDR